MTRSRIALLLVLASLVAAFFALDLGRFLDLGMLKRYQAALAGFYTAHPLALAAAFFALYVAVTALSLPGAAILTLAAGAVFGLLTGTVIVSFASSVGATLAFLSARYLLRDTVQGRFGTRLAEVNAGVERDGPFYLFSLRLVPLFPFFVVNLLMGLTPMRTATFYAVSQVGMLAGTIVYVNAGTQLSRVQSLRGILSPALIASLALLGLFPLVARKAAAWVRARSMAGRHSPPGPLPPRPKGTQRPGAA